MKTRPRKVCFVGGGAMASAIIGGVLRTPELEMNPSQFCVVDPFSSALQRAKENFPEIHTSAALNETILKDVDVIFLAVKPQVAAAVLQDLKLKLDFTLHNGDCPSSKILFVSVMAGISLEKICSILVTPRAVADTERAPRVIRVMPNTALLAGHGCSCFCASTSCTSHDRGFVQRWFGSLGFCAEVAESQLDAVTGVAGSGPAFVAAFAEALADGGVLAGLPRQLAVSLAVHTVQGSAKLMTPGPHGLTSTLAVKEMVASPAGTTIAGLRALEAGRFRFVTMSAVEAAAERSKQLSKL